MTDLDSRICNAEFDLIFCQQPLDFQSATGPSIKSILED